MAKRVKTAEEVEAKMRDRVSTAGKYLKEGIAQAEDPIDVLLSDPKKYEGKLQAGLNEAIKQGKYKAGLEKAKKRDAWKNSQDRAGRHYEERTEDMVNNSMSDYEARKACIEKAKKAIEAMPTTTRQQRIQRSAKYQDEVGKCFDKIYGRA